MAFAADGKPLTPFGGDNVLDGGIIADINGDGLVERVSYTNHSLAGREMYPGS